jgi:hypothetical protein
MTLLLVGIVAVILVILVAAFLTFRRGQDDDQDEPGGRWTVRDRVRSAGRDGHWRSSAQDVRAPRRAEPARRQGERSRGYDDSTPEYGGRRPGRGRRDEQDDRSYPGRAPERYADAPDAADYPAARARGPRAAGTPAQRRPARRQPDSYDTVSYDAADYGSAGHSTGGHSTGGHSTGGHGKGGHGKGGRSAGGYDTGGYDTGPAEQLYDTGPSAALDDDLSNTGAHEFAVDLEDDSALTDSDVFPRIREDIPAKASKPPAAAKSRSRQSRSSKRGDDDDWPSTEWDKLSDEQYWAELSADKPLATTARTAQPAAAKAAPAPPKPQPVQPKPAQARPAAAKPPRPAAAPAKPAPDRESVAPRRRDRQQDAPTEALPVRSRPRPAAAPVGQTPPAQRPLPREAGEPSLAMLTSLASSPSGRRAQAAVPPRDDDPLTSPSFSRQATPTQDSRSYRNVGRSRQRGGTGDYPTGDYSTGDYPAGGYPSGGHPSGSYPSGSYPGGSQGYPAADSEHTNPQAAYPSAGWQAERQPAPKPAPPQAAPPVPPQPALPLPTPVRAPAGNPYGSYVDGLRPSQTGSHAAGYQPDRARPAAGYDGYPPPASAYPEPPFRQPAGTAPGARTPGRHSGWHAAPPPAAPDYPADPASQYLYTGGSGYPDSAGYAAGQPAEPSPQAGYPESAGYPEGGYNSTGYADGYSTDPYGPDGYGSYRPRQT